MEPWHEHEAELTAMLVQDALGLPFAFERTIDYIRHWQARSIPAKMRARVKRVAEQILAAGMVAEERMAA